MLNSKNKLLITLLLIVVGMANAQIDRFTAAYDSLNSGNLEAAKLNIDIAITERKSEKDALVWYLRGFIYKEIYNKSEKDNVESPSRMEALKSFKTSYIIDTTQQNVQENLKNIKYLVTTLYNDAATTLDSVRYKTSLTTFDIFKDYYALVDSSQASKKQYDIKYLLALASLYSQIYDSDKKAKLDFLNLAKNSYNKILTIDPNNISANYNMGILYYNQAVSLINQSDFDIDIIALNDIQDNSINLFKESLPFMEKAFELDPRRKETLLGLSGIYFSLNEFEKSNMFKRKLDEIEKQK